MLPIPVTVVSGFLGSGKTTLINRILREEHGLSIAVIVNDVGDLDVDAALLRDQGDEIVSLRNGCVCCSMQGDLVSQVARLVDEKDFDHIIIEASGVSEPGNIVRALKYPQLRDTVFTSAVVALIDAELFPELKGNARYLAGEQLAAADVVLLNKVDLVSSQRLASVTESCACPNLAIIECSYADISLDLFFSTDHTQRSESGPHRLDAKGEFFETRIWRPTGPVDLEVLRQVLQSISSNVIRSKGFVQSVRDDECWLVQAVGRRTNLTKTINSEAAALVLIGVSNENDWVSIFNDLEVSVVSESATACRESTQQTNQAIANRAARIRRIEGHS